MEHRERSARALAWAMFAVAFGTNVPTPLLLLYRTELDLSPVVLTALFGVYAVGLLPALFVAGPASDRLGRRAVVAPFALLSLLASLVFLGAGRSVLWLLVGRLLQGAVSGAVFSVGSAWMGELVADPELASRRATIALTAGFGLGPAVTGVVAQLLPAPLVLPYLLHVGLMVVGLVVLRRVPETHTAPDRGGPLLHLGVSRDARRAFVAFAVPAGLCVFTFPAIALAVLPLRLQAAMPGVDLLVTGLVGGVTMTSGVLVQRLVTRLGAPVAAPVGALAGVAGIGVGLLAGRIDAPWLLLVAAVLLGGAYGLTLAAGLTATQALADPAARGALTATFYAVTYLGFAVPVLLSLVSTGTDYDAALIVVALAGLVAAGVLRFGPGARLVAERRAAAART
ncbi:MAG: MFS family permease [Myxococcota bacterium]|jgi:MFS family permease